MKQNRKNLKEIAKESGLDRVYCSCGKTVSGIALLEMFFQKILENCKEGNEVYIKKFGIFRAVRLKKRKIKSHVLDGKTCKINDDLVLRFYRLRTAKRFLNSKAKKK